MKLTEKCPHCNKQAVVQHEEISSILSSRMQFLLCGHTILLPLDLSSTNGNAAETDRFWSNLRQYQKDGVDFIKRSGYNCLIADEMGLGKTIQALGSIRYAKDTVTPVIFVVKSSLRYNWFREILKWLSAHEYQEHCDLSNLNPDEIPFIIHDGRSVILPGYKYYIVSMDVLTKRMIDLTNLNAQLIVVDESQAFKDQNAKRTKALIGICASIPRRICLSGTPILNRAGEYFTTLNILRPDKFYNRAKFYRDWIEFDYERKQYGGIKRRYQDLFMSNLQDFVIRRLRSEVLTELPKFARYLEMIQIDDPLFRKAYDKERSNLEDYLKHAANAGVGGFEMYTNVLAMLTRMRQIVGVAKVSECISKVEEFFESYPDKKLAIGIHHKIVARQLSLGLAKFNPVFLSGEMNAEARQDSESKFRNSHNLLIASTLAAGEGLNLQYCSDAIILERQWNSAKEVQFEGRFHRMGQKNPVTITYIIARGSIDEWITELVERKRGYVNSAIINDDADNDSDDNLGSGYMELAQATVRGHL